MRSPMLSLRMQRPFGVLLYLLVGFWSFATPTGANPTADVPDSFVVERGEVHRMQAGDVLEASRTIVIRGRLVIEGGSAGASEPNPVRLVAGERIVISGEVELLDGVAGSSAGEAGGAGGSCSISAPLIEFAGTTYRAGNGGRGGPGGDGGAGGEWIIEGAVSHPARMSVGFVAGNGGRGGDGDWSIQGAEHPDGGDGGAGGRVLMSDPFFDRRLALWPIDAPPPSFVLYRGVFSEDAGLRDGHPGPAATGGAGGDGGHGADFVEGKRVGRGGVGGAGGKAVAGIGGYGIHYRGATLAGHGGRGGDATGGDGGAGGNTGDGKRPRPRAGKGGIGARAEGGNGGRGGRNDPSVPPLLNGGVGGNAKGGAGGAGGFPGASGGAGGSASGGDQGGHAGW